MSAVWLGMSFYAGHAPYIQRVTVLEISECLEDLGYPNQAQKAASGEPTLMREAASWLRVEATYVKEGAGDLLVYAIHLDEAAELETRVFG